MQTTAHRRSTLQPPGRRAGRRALALLVGTVLLAIVCGGAVVGYYNWCQGASGPRTPVTLRVPQGTSGSGVVDLLHERGIIRCGLVSKILLRNSGLSDDVRAGTFELTTNMTPDEAFAAVTAKPPAPAPAVRLTIPEGYRLTQIAQRVERDVGIPARRFLAEAADGSYSLPPYLPQSARALEGFLFPKTYDFPKGQTTAGEVIVRLLEQFRDEVAGLPWKRADVLGVTPYEVVVIASMIEREAGVPQDRARIAAVIYNRLALGMELGIDATIQYIDPNPDDGLTESDLEIRSPYNTRLNSGLPPTPIASPGLPSIEAALNPAHVDFLYYVLCGNDGHHAFSVSYEKFLRLTSECLG